VARSPAAGIAIGPSELCWVCTKAQVCQKADLGMRSMESHADQEAEPIAQWPWN
jgi:hypothetical protein